MLKMALFFGQPSDYKLVVMNVNLFVKNSRDNSSKKPRVLAKPKTLRKRGPKKKPDLILPLRNLVVGSNLSRKKWPILGDVPDLSLR